MVRKGIAFPVGTELGTLAVSEGATRLDQAVKLRLLTPRGTRLGYEKNFGSRLLSFVHRGTPSGLVQTAVVEALKDEPRIEVLRVDVQDDMENNKMLISVSYRDKQYGTLMTTEVQV